MGSARALAESLKRTHKLRDFSKIERQKAGHEARPATPGAGVLPNFGFRVE
jgi:hypothetical protein